MGSLPDVLPACGVSVFVLGTLAGPACEVLAVSGVAELLAAPACIAPAEDAQVCSAFCSLFEGAATSELLMFCDSGSPGFSSAVKDSAAATTLRRASFVCTEGVAPEASPEGELPLGALITASTPASDTGLALAPMLVLSFELPADGNAVVVRFALEPGGVRPDTACVVADGDGCAPA